MSIGKPRSCAEFHWTAVIHTYLIAARLSPDGKMLAYAVNGSPCKISHTQMSESCPGLDYALNQVSTSDEGSDQLVSQLEAQF